MIIDPSRLLADMRKLASFGAYKTGVHRPSLSPQDIAARHWLMTRIQDAGLTPHIDGIGNVYGENPHASRKILSGSHLESQNHAGWLDGALGVIYALEAARALRESGASPDVGVDVVAFCDEEGHFGSFLGSRSLTGELDDADLQGLVDRTTGVPLEDALATAQLTGIPRRRLATADYVAFMEAHIEQGNTLESVGKTIGVVTSIVGLHQYQIVVTGEQNHAGTTMMSRRRDAGQALILLLADIENRFAALAASNTVWTTGNVIFNPGSKSIIAGRAEAWFQFRDVDAGVLAALDQALHAAVAQANAVGRCAVTLKNAGMSLPAAMDDGLQARLRAAADRVVPGAAMSLPSGAGHDAQWLARKLPTAMLFVPSINGISHHWSENTSDEDIVRGADVFAEAIRDVLTR